MFSERHLVFNITTLTDCHKTVKGMNINSQYRSRNKSINKWIIVNISHFVLAPKNSTPHVEHFYWFAIRFR